MTRLWPDAVRWRLTLWHSVVLGMLLVSFAAASYSMIATVLASRTDRFLEEARDAFADELHAEDAEMATADDAIQAALTEFRLGETRFAVYDSSLRLIGMTAPHAVAARDPRAPFDSPALHPDRLARSLAGFPRADTGVVTIGDPEGGYRVARAPARLHGRPYIVVAFQPRHGMVETLEAIAAAYLIGVPLFLLLAGASGYYLARRSLSPIAELSRQAKAISGASLGERLHVANPRDELGVLTLLLNELLGRVEDSMERQRRFVADASHELRTPVAIVSAEADIALSRDHRSEGEYRDAFRIVQDAGRRLSRIVDDLFLLARADAGHQPIRREELYLGDLTVDVARSVRALAAPRSIRVDVAAGPDAPFVGDEEMLGRMLLNLFDNAVKYSAPGSTVAASIAEQDGRYEISIADAGPGIPLDARDRVFERFYRLDKARSRSKPGGTSGAGLGLAIARWIAEAHGGSITISRSDATGTEFLVTLPKPLPSAFAG